ncbi:hypothetical protein [uncultured Hoeflea sp.]|uniref:hypothetical protein n=1 Tax=uncultured Hoeflea sp. TaxID=538666 RepID=UPI00260E38F6|nr:hypothetical protein [uncultured Hoeflea sp.]
MKRYFVTMLEQFKSIRMLALEANQPMLAYYAEMGIDECELQLSKQQQPPKR